MVFSSDSVGTGSGFNATILVHEAPLRPEVGVPGYCSACFPCGVNEGHCQSHDQCISGHFCLLDSCPSSLEFTNTTSCCQDVDVTCGFADVNNGLLLSPNYPNDYQNNLQCSHTLTTEPGKFITIEFQSFKVSCVSSLETSWFNVFHFRSMRMII